MLGATEFWPEGGRQGVGLEKRQISPFITLSVSIMMRSSIALGLVGMMAFAILALAAAGATLEDPAGASRVVILIGAYIALDLGAIAAMTLAPSRKWPWILGGSLIAVPLIALRTRL